ncbi:MAG: di-heme oxidoredictase family protein [Candidatus Sericytochromatia bacterium]
MSPSKAFLLLLLLSACQPGPLPRPAATVDAKVEAKVDTVDQSLSAGRATVTDSSREAFSHRIPDRDEAHRTAFFSGESLFDQNWITAPSSTEARDGLGPLFNARACASCHVKDGRGNPFDASGQSLEPLLVRLSQPGRDAHGGPVPDPVYGGQLQPFALQNQVAEGQLEITRSSLSGKYADGQAYSLEEPHYRLIKPGYGPFSPELQLSVRQSPQLVGLGLLEQVPAAEILSWADEADHDRDGISGRPNQVWDQQTGQTVLGRFGWKANQPNLAQQVAGAFSGDIGISSRIYPQQEYSPVQAPALQKLPNGGQPELEAQLLDRVIFYSRNLAVPARRGAEQAKVRTGEQQFTALKCQACHRAAIPLGQDSLHPYSDLLLHDMGPELADQRPDFLASGQEWRTPPLWGIGLIEKVNGHTRFLHDGRARNLTEAVLWHGGEAAAAREGFKNLDAAGRQALITFLESL